MPFDGSDSRHATLAMIDAPLAFFSENGERCLVGARRRAPCCRVLPRNAWPPDEVQHLVSGGATDNTP